MQLKRWCQLMLPRGKGTVLLCLALLPTAPGQPSGGLASPAPGRSVHHLPAYQLSGVCANDHGGYLFCR